MPLARFSPLVGAVLLAAVGLTFGDLIHSHPSYYVLAPTSVRANSEFTVTASVLKLEYPSVTFHVAIRKWSKDENVHKPIASNEVTFKDVGTQQIKVKTLDNLTPGNYTLRVSAYSDREQQGQLFTNDTELFLDSNRALLMIQLNQPFYKQGQTVKFRVLALRRDLLPMSTVMDITIYDPNGIILTSWNNMHTNAGGVVSLSYRLSGNRVDNGRTRYWTIEVLSEQQSVKEMFTIDEFWGSTQWTNVSVPSYILSDSVGLMGSVNSNMSNGYPDYGNATISLEFFHIDGQPLDVKPLTRVLPLFEGRADFIFPMEEMKLRAGGPESIYSKKLKVTVRVLNWEHEYSGAGWNTALVFKNDVQLTFLGGRVKTFKPGFPFSIYLTGETRDGMPLQAYNPNRTIHLEIITLTTDGPSDLVVYDTVELNDKSVAEYRLHPSHKTLKYLIKAKWMNERDTRVDMVATKVWSPNRQYIDISTSTKRPKVGQYVTFHVRSNTFVETAHYHLMAHGTLLNGGTITMDGKNKILALAVSRDMIPRARIIVFFLAVDGQVISDSLAFPVDGTHLHNVTVKFNRGKDMSYKTIEITARADPLSYIAFSSIMYDMYTVGGSTAFQWSKVYERLNAFDGFANSSLEYRWQRDGRVVSDFAAASSSYGSDFNSTLFYSGLYMFSDANVSSVYTFCNKTRGYLPCSNGLACYVATDICDYHSKCAFDSRDEMGCHGHNNETRYNLQPNLFTIFRNAHKGRDYLTGAFAWVDQFTKPDGRIDITVKVPALPFTWALTAFSISAENGLGISEPTLFDGLRPLIVKLQGPGRVRRGEQVGLRVIVFNSWDQEMEVLLTVPESDDYRFMEVNRDNGARASPVEGDHQVLISIQPSKDRMLYLPISMMRFGHIKVPVRATSFVAGTSATYHVFVDYEGVEERWLTNMQYDLTKSSALVGYDWAINVAENLRDQDESLPNYISDSPRTSIYIQGDIIGTSFYPTANYDLSTEKLLNLPSGDAVGLLYNFAINMYTLKMIRDLGPSNYNPNMRDRVIDSMNSRLQELFYMANRDGSFRSFRFSTHPSVWVTSMVLDILTKAKNGIIELETMVYIDNTALERMAVWLNSTQRGDGAFVESGAEPNRHFRSRSTIDINSSPEPSSLALTSLCYLALASAQGYLTGRLATEVGAQQKALSYLSTYWYLANDPFELSIVTYALLTGGRPEAISAFSKLQLKQRQDAGFIYLSTQTMRAEEAETQLDARILLKQKSLSNATSYTVAATSYAILCYLKNGFQPDSETVYSMQSFLQQQRDGIGGFSSPYDSLVAFSALNSIAEVNQDRWTYKMLMNITSDQDTAWKAVLTLNQSNWFNPQILQAPSHWGRIIPSLEGNGIALMQMLTKLNHKFSHQLRQPLKPSFSLGNIDASIKTSGFNHSLLHYNICPEWTGDGERSGFAVLEVGIPSGYAGIFSNRSLYSLVRGGLDSSSLRHAEEQNDRFVFYFDYLDRTESNCAKFSIIRRIPVANISEQQYLKVYEYYEPGNFNHTIYEKIELNKLTVCLVCGSYQCPFCPHYAGADSSLPNPLLLLLACIIPMVWVSGSGHWRL